MLVTGGNDLASGRDVRQDDVNLPCLTVVVTTNNICSVHYDTEEPS